MDEQTPNKPITITLTEQEWQIMTHALMEHGERLVPKLNHPSVIVRAVSRELLTRIADVALKLAAQLEKQGA